MNSGPGLDSKGSDLVLNQPLRQKAVICLIRSCENLIE